MCVCVCFEQGGEGGRDGGVREGEAELRERQEAKDREI